MIKEKSPPKCRPVQDEHRIGRRNNGWEVVRRSSGVRLAVTHCFVTAPEKMSGILPLIFIFHLPLALIDIKVPWVPLGLRLACFAEFALFLWLFS